MQKILLLGAGKSSITLIDYLVENAPVFQWDITVADLTKELAESKTKCRAHTCAIAIDLKNEMQRHALIAAHHLVISMLPASFHTLIATDCLQLRKHLVTPSYISSTMLQLHEAVKNTGLTFMNEMGLDPGIDHMSAMEIIERLKTAGAEIFSYRSHCGGLVAKRCDDNSFHYKFSWNPRNVVLAGQGDGGIRWRENGVLREIHYHQLFSTTHVIDLGADGTFESYPNRDSLKYVTAYGLEHAATFYRGTLRVPPFCTGWNALVQMGLTDPTKPYTFQNREDVKLTAIEYELLDSIGVFNPANFDNSKSAADNLQALLEKSWAMQATDTDLVVMIHEIGFSINGRRKNLRSSLLIEGEDNVHTAMARTVGLPVAIVAKMILTGALQERGVLLPNFKNVYTPIMHELATHGIVFKETETHHD